MPTTEELRRQFYEISEAIAPTWESRRAHIEEVAAPVRDWMVSELAPRPGDTVLELAAGVGDTGFEAARIVGPDGRLICSDFSRGMLDAARRRGRELGLDNVDYRVIDAERIDLDDDSVDGVLCRYGYMLTRPRCSRRRASTRFTPRRARPASVPRRGSLGLAGFVAWPTPAPSPRSPRTSRRPSRWSSSCGPTSTGTGSAASDGHAGRHETTSASPPAHTCADLSPSRRSSASAWRWARAPSPRRAHARWDSG